MNQEARERRRISLLWSGAALVFVVLAPLAPFVASFAPPCIFKTLTGIPCPLCGTTRAALALAHLAPLEGLARYPLPTLLWIGFLAGGLAAGVSVVLKRPWNPPRRKPRWAGIALAAAVAGNWIYSIATGV